MVLYGEARKTLILKRFLTNTPSDLRRKMG